MFDRGCKQVQAAAELKAVRDMYIHPKVKKQQYVMVDENVWDTDFGVTNVLKIPKNPRIWGRSHAIAAIKATNDFFNLFFLCWCGFDANTVCEILLGSDAVAIPAKSSTVVDCIGGLNRAVTMFGIDFKFIGKNVV
jgi:hypothetical protein